MSIFGSGSAFGANNSNASGAAQGSSTVGGGVFGSGSAFGAAKPTGTGVFGSAPATGGGSIFGGGTIPASSAFGVLKPAEQPAQAAQLPASTFFSQPPASGSGGLFGQPKSAEASTTPNPVFGTPAPATGASAAPTSLFGSGGGLFGKPAAPASASTNPLATAAPLSDSTPVPATAPKTNIFSGGGFGSGGSAFGSKPAATADTAPAVTGSEPAPAASNTFLKPATGGGLFGTPPAAASTAPAASTSGTPTTSLFGALKTTEKKDAPTTTAPTGSLFGASKPEEKKDTAGAPAASSSLFSVGGAKPTEPGVSTPTLAPATTATVTVQPPSMLRGKTIEEIVNKWSTDLETQVREFNKHAGEVAVWDRALIENGNNLSAILSHVMAAEREQHEVVQALDNIEQQQRDLAATLDTYEKAAQELSGSSGRIIDKGPADMERDKNYMLATDLQVHLDDLSSSLTQMIESVNSLSLPSNESSAQDPMAQIAQILSSHLESLQWIDGAVREVEGKVSDVEKKVKESGHGQALRARQGYGVR